MRYSLILFLFFLLHSCSTSSDCRRSDVPEPPHGTPDDTTEYSSGDYYSIDYTYYCLGGQYVSITYSIYSGECWEESEFTSSGICD